MPLISFKLETHIAIFWLSTKLPSLEHDIVEVLPGEAAVQIVLATLQAAADELPLERRAEGEQVPELGHLHPEVERIHQAP